MEEIAKNNKLIAEFDGLKKFPIEFCRYHNSWNWLMPVVEKIESLDLKEWFYKWKYEENA